MQSQVTETTYNFTQYVEKGRWNSYFHQITEVLALKPSLVLLIGVGDGIVTDILLKQGIQVTTMDFEAWLKPDIILDVKEIDKIGRKFDIIVCCQVLEHLPFADFTPVLSKIMAQTQHLILSLPIQHYRMFSLLRIQKALFDRIVYTIPKIYKVYKFNGEHHWELGTRGYSRKKIEKIIRSKFEVSHENIVPENTYHQYYVVHHKTKQ